MKARVWFQAQGQRLRSHGLDWVETKRAIGLYGLPRWAQCAVARGHLNQSTSRERYLRCDEKLTDGVQDRVASHDSNRDGGVER